MRDPKRIWPILKELAVIWNRYPDLRLGQLIGNRRRNRVVLCRRR